MRFQPRQIFYQNLPDFVSELSAYGVPAIWMECVFGKTDIRFKAISLSKSLRSWLNEADSPGVPDAPTS